MDFPSNILHVSWIQWQSYVKNLRKHPSSLHRRIQLQGLDSCILSTPSHLANVELGEGFVSAFETTLDHQCSSTTSHKFAVVISINNGSYTSQVDTSCYLLESELSDANIEEERNILRPPAMNFFFWATVRPFSSSTDSTAVLNGLALTVQTAACDTRPSAKGCDLIQIIDITKSFTFPFRYF